MGIKKMFSLKNDNYRKARGGYARFLNLYCSSCKHPLVLYQKDGPGPLKRLYLDRVLTPEISKNKKELICKSCRKIIGTRYIYKKENRPAIRLYQDAITKKISRGIYIIK
ncbi:MAG: hypothetical protein NTZ18_04835 [Candidatus Komeilibacteria bacterium]|nr:hypothetical protein [Candidatus Komeilibacteria bacterium]